MPNLTTTGPRLGVLVLALSLVPAAQAQGADPGGSLERYVASGGELVSLVKGRGLARVAGRGAVWGNLGRGRVLIRDLPDAKGTEIGVRGEEWSRVVDAGTTLYGGRGLRFRAIGGRWAVRVTGKRVNASAAGRGTLTLRGSAGTFAIGDHEPREWPDTRTTYRFGD